MILSLRSVSPALLSYRDLLPAVAALAAFAFLGVASSLAQPPERPVAKNPTASPQKSPRPAKKNDAPAKPAHQKGQAEKKGAEQKPDASRLEERKSDREAIARKFAEEHHPELASLLATLEKMSPQAYQSAVRDVARAADRLNAMKERDDARYERELKVWKTRSRVHVVSAEYRISPGADLEQKLRALMQDELQAKRELLAFERERAEKRLDQLDRQLRELDEKGSAMIDRQIERLPKLPASIPKSKPKT